MPISETIQYTIMFGLSVIFSILSFALDENRIIMKIIAGLCWNIFAILQWVMTSPPTNLVYAFSFLFFGFGFVFWASTVQDWFRQKKEAIWSFE